jgi:flagellar brake protein
MDAANSSAVPRTGPVSSPSLERYMIYNEHEIKRLLRDIGDNNELVTLYLDNGGDFVLTSVLAITAASVILDYGTREEQNRRVLASRRLMFITSREKIKVQWTAGSAERVSYGGKPAFRIALPAKVLRLQRREYFRLTTPIAKPLTGSVTTGTPPHTEKLEFTIADISLGGISAIGAPQQPTLEVGKIYDNCEIALPELGTLVTTLAAVNVFELTLRNGHQSLRCGCQFVDLRGGMLTMLQRYINRIERERLERMARLA